MVIVGAGLALKLAWDLGYLGQLSDAGKSLAMSLFGAALLVAGEAARRRAGRAAGEGLTAAGLGVLFATIYAMTARFQLLSGPASFAALLTVVLVGLAVSARAGMVVVPAVAVAGGFLAPALVNARPLAGPMLPAYYLALATVAFGVCAWRGNAFAPARTVAWWCTLIFGGAWAVSRLASTDASYVLAFTVLVWLLTHAALLHRAARASRTDEWPPNHLGYAVGSALTTSGWTTLLGVLAIVNTHPSADWVLPAVLTALSLAQALLLSRGPAALRRDPVVPAEHLAVALALQAGALGLLAALLALADWTLPAVFVAIGVAAVVAGRRAAWLCGYGRSALTLGTLAALVAASDSYNVLFHLGGLDITRGSVHLAIAAAGWFLVGRFGGRGPVAAVTGGGIALALALVAALPGRPDPRWVMGTWAALGALFAIGAPLAPAMRLREIGLVGVFFSIVAWAATDIGRGWDTGPLLGTSPLTLHVGAATAGVLTGIAATIGLALRHQSRSDGLRRAFGSAGVVAALLVLLTATSLETARYAAEFLTDPTARRAVVSLWWGIFAVSLLVAGARWRAPSVRYGGLALLLTATTKAVAFDLDQVAPAWRVASFLLLGLLLLGVATAYARAASRARVSPEPPR